MKTPKKVKVIQSAPSNGQCGIEAWIGREFEVRRGGYNAEEKTVQVEGPQGAIVLQPSEYIVTE